MKRLISLTFSLLVFSSLAWAQRPSFKPQAHQVELQLGTAHNLIPGGDALLLNEGPLVFNPINGLRYTYHYSLTHGFRAGALRLNSLHDASNGAITQFPRTGEMTRYEISLGYIYKYHNRRSQVYVAVDGLYEPGTMVSRVEMTGFEESKSFRGFGGKAGVGYRFFFSPYLSFGVEGNLKYLNRVAGAFGPDPSFSFFQEQELSWQAGANLSFHFVKMKKRCTCPTVGKSKYR